MPNPHEVAELAPKCAHEAVDQLVALIGSGEPWADESVAPELTLIEITRRTESGRADRACWEGHAALELLFAARQVLAPDDDDAIDVDGR